MNLSNLKQQENLLEVIRELMIEDLEKQVTDIQYKAHIEEIDDNAPHVVFFLKQTNEKIERLHRAYNPYK